MVFSLYYVIGSKVECLYTTHGKHGSMHDVDGIRCWLPCLDSASQRPVFDINITLPNVFSVKSCGQRLAIRSYHDAPGVVLPVSGKRYHQYGTQVSEFCTHRYFTTTRIPACNVGFFAGIVERYSVPFYRLDGVVWVTRGIIDKAVVDLVIDGADAVRGFSAAAQSADITMDIVVDETDPELSENEADVVALYDDNEQDHELNRDGDNENSDINGIDINGDVAATTRKPGLKAFWKTVLRKRQLFEANVKHTTMGLDIALRMIHKFVYHRYDHQSYTQIFVHGLGEDFHAFDGFTLIDANYLHTENLVYQETASHLMQITAYLYSWIKCSLPIDSFDCEFILHGVVGYLVDFYAEQLFGEDSAMYR